MEPLIGAVAAAVVAFVVHLAEARRTDREVARHLLSDLTTGEVADARAPLGSVVHGSQGTTDVDVAAVRSAYFTLLWSFERIYFGRESLEGVLARSTLLRRFSIRRDFDRSISWQVVYWGKNLNTVRTWIEQESGESLHDASSRWAFAELLESADWEAHLRDIKRPLP